MDDCLQRLREIAQHLKLDRPLCVLDLETTGLNVRHDRIVELVAYIASPDGGVRQLRSLVRPEKTMPDEARAIHGLTDTDLLGAPTFASIARPLAEALKPCDFVGYNVSNFDLRVLAAEFRRAGVDYDPTNARVIDAMTIFHRKERRNLQAAVKLYCGRPHRGHRAEEDVRAVVDVVHAQLQRYRDLPQSVASLDQWCRARAYQTP